MTGFNLFTPTGSTVNITAATTTGRVALGNRASIATSVRVKNLDAANAAFIVFGDSTVTATLAAGVPIGPGETAGFTVGPTVTHAAAITPSSTAVVYFTPGQGI